LEPGFAAALVALAIDHVSTGIHHRSHLGQQLRRILQVGVNDQHTLATAEIEPRAQRNLVAIIAGEIDDDNMGVLVGKGIQLRQRAVAGAVIDVDDLLILLSYDLAYSRNSAVEFGYAGFFIVTVRYNGEFFPCATKICAHSRRPLFRTP